MNYTDVFGNNTVPPSDFGYQAYTLSANASAYWPYNYAGTGFVLAKNNDVLASLASLELTLPDASTVSEGEDFVIKNSGANTFTVKDAGGNVLTTIVAGTAKYFVLTDNTTVAGVYAITTFGTGTSTADASVLAGAGHRVNGTEIDNVIESTSISGSYVISAVDNATTIIYTTGTATLPLPAMVDVYNGFFFMFNNSGSGTVTFDPAGSVTIDGASTKDIQPGESCIVTTNGSNYYTVGYGRSSTYAWTQLSVDLTGLSAYTVSTTQAVNKLWAFSGVPTASLDITIPAVASVYFVKVGAIGAYTATFTTGSGATTGLTANQYFILFCDGTNVSVAQTISVTSTLALSDGSASAPSFNFSLDSDTGIYRIGTNSMGVAAGGVQVGSFTAAGFTGEVVGNASSATVSATTTIVDDTATNALMYPTWVTATSGNLPEKVSSANFRFNPSTGTLYVTNLSGALTGNVIGNLTGNADTATLAATATRAVNIDGGAANQLALQSAVNTTGFLAMGANGTVLTSTGVGNVPSWIAGVPSTTATNLLGGVAGVVPYQLATDTTAYTSVGLAGQVLTSQGSGTPTWTTVASATTINITSQTATAGQTVFTTSYVVGLLDVYQNGVRLQPTVDFTAGDGTSVTLTTGALLNDILMFQAYTALNMGMATSTANINAGGAGQVVYQTGVGATGFVPIGTTGQVLISNGTGAPTWGTIPPSTGSILYMATNYGAF